MRFLLTPVITMTLVRSTESVRQRLLRNGRNLQTAVSNDSSSPTTNRHRFNIQLVNAGKVTCTYVLYYLLHFGGDRSAHWLGFVSFHCVFAQHLPCLLTMYCSFCFSCLAFTFLSYVDFDDIMQEAAARWEEVIIGDVEDVPANPIDPHFDWFDGAFGSWVPPYNKDVDDVVIGYAFYPKSFFDNSTTTLGRASPRYIRNYDKDRWAPPMSAISGVMQFNLDAIQESNYTRNDLRVIVTHEMAHVLGVGGDFWRSNCARDCLQWVAPNGNFQLGDDAYRCVHAQQAYYDLGLRRTERRGVPLLVNHDGSLGNVCSHWAEWSFRVKGVSSELMTPFFESGIAQPLSTVTIGALEDIGYKVNYSAADDFPNRALLPSHQRRRLDNHGTHSPMTPDHSFDLSRLMDHTQDVKPRTIRVSRWS